VVVVVAPVVCWIPSGYNHCQSLVLASKGSDPMKPEDEVTRLRRQNRRLRVALASVLAAFLGSAAILAAQAVIGYTRAVEAQRAAIEARDRAEAALAAAQARFEEGAAQQSQTD
jgi:hypothetical protein